MYRILFFLFKYHFGGYDDCNTVIESYFIQGVCDLPIAFFEFLIPCYIRFISLILLLYRVTFCARTNYTTTVSLYSYLCISLCIIIVFMHYKVCRNQ